MKKAIDASDARAQKTDVVVPGDESGESKVTVANDDPGEAKVDAAAPKPKITATMQGRQSRWSTKQIAIAGLFAAIGIVLSMIEIPLFPPAPYLKYDPANTTAALGGIAYGPGLGALIGIIIHSVHALFGSSGLWGTLMNAPGVLAFMLPVSFICRRSKSSKRLIIGLAIGSILSTIVMILMNLIVMPLYTETTIPEVAAIILPVLLPFNLIKVVLNSVLTFVLYKSLQKVLEK